MDGVQPPQGLSHFEEAVYFNQKSILNDNSFKEYTNLAAILIKNMCYNKSSLLFQLVATNVYRKQSLRGVP